MSEHGITRASEPLKDWLWDSLLVCLHEQAYRALSILQTRQHAVLNNVFMLRPVLRSFPEATGMAFDVLGW